MRTQRRTAFFCGTTYMFFGVNQETRRPKLGYVTVGLKHRDMSARRGYHKRHYSLVFGVCACTVSPTSEAYRRDRVAQRALRMCQQVRPPLEAHNTQLNLRIYGYPAPLMFCDSTVSTAVSSVWSNLPATEQADSRSMHACS